MDIRQIDPILRHRILFEDDVDMFDSNTPVERRFLLKDRRTTFKTSDAHLYSDTGAWYYGEKESALATSGRSAARKEDL